MHNKTERLLFVTILFTFSCTFFLTPAAAAEHEDVLVNGTAMYLTTGEMWEFYQGYALHIKGTSQEGDRIWLELLLDGESVKDTIMSEGESFSYCCGSKEIFNITVDTIYAGPEGGLVTFKPVYQYTDPTLDEPVPTQPAAPPVTANGSVAPTEAEDVTGFGAGMLFIGISTAALLKMRYRHR